jgi:hypothetical protein
MDDTKGTSYDSAPSGIEEIKDWVVANFTSQGCAVQSSGAKCFKLTLPQQFLNVETLVEGVAARGGAIDLHLETVRFL